jgi:ABC-type phosphate transport system substrate-binding protein
MPFVAVEPPGKLHENQMRLPLFAEKALLYRRVLIAGLFFLVSVLLAAARDLAVVINPANSVTALTLPDLVKICNAQTSRWPDGKPVTLILRAPSAPEMTVLLEKVYQLSQAQVRSLIAAANHGRANHPAIMVVDSDEELIKKVASIPGAVGVVDVYSINSSITVIKVGGKLPLEPGYVLHGN